MSDGYEVVPESVVIALDLGGTKLAGALVDRTGRCSHRLQQPTQLSGREATLAQVRAAAKALQQRARDSACISLGIGISVPAVVDSDRGYVLWAPNIPGWQDVPLGAILQADLNLPVQVEYDGHAAALGEAWCGAGSTVRNMLLVIIGTGIGGGMILEQRLYRGGIGIAGALGWFVVDPARAETGSQRQFGQLESLCAGPAIARRAQALAVEGTCPVLVELVRGDVTAISAREVFQAAQRGDKTCTALLNDVAETLGIALANAVTLLNPELIVLSGGVGASAQSLIEPIIKTIRKHAQPVAAQSVRVVTTALGEDAALLGAAQLIWQQIGNVKEGNAYGSIPGSRCY
jgi:glucokinase